MMYPGDVRVETGPFSTPPSRRFRLTLGGAILISLLLHLLLVVGVMVSGAANVLILPLSPSVPSQARPPGSLQFTFVDVPDDEPVTANPQARLLSDKDRVARQSVPTPPDATQFSTDPHSVGNSQLRQLPRGAPPSTAASPTPPAGSRGREQSAGASGTGQAPPDSTEGKDPEPEVTEEGPRAKVGEGSQGGSATGDDKRAAFQRALRQLESGTYDFSGFENPAYLQGNNYGTLSFDTKGFDWGDYARQLYLIIKKNWYDRIPIAAYYGQKGKVFIRFVIEKNGTITDLAVIRSSEISPFDRAAENAIRASNPLPPLPTNFPKDSEGVTFGFFYNLPIDHN